MATGEDQPQAVIGVAVLPRFGPLRARRFERRETLEDPPLVGERPLAAEPIDRSVPRDPRDPGAGVVGNAIARPALERNRERLLDRILGGVEIAEDPDQRGDRPPRLAPEQAVDLAAVVGYDATPSLVCSVEPPAAS